MKKLLWIGDANCDSGFAKCTHYTLDTLRHHFDVEVLGLNHPGDPHDYPYKIYPVVSAAGGDFLGIRRIPMVLERVRPDVIVIQNDPWNIPHYTKAIDAVKDVPRALRVGAIAIDGKNCLGALMNGLDHAIFWTKFAQMEAIKGGFTKTSDVIPLGVDTKIYRPIPKAEARAYVGLPESLKDAFIIGNVNRNQPRKRLDLTIRAFAEWIRQDRIEDAYLFLHVAPTGDIGYNLEAIAHYYGLGSPKRLIMSEPAVFKGVSEQGMANIYNSMDVLMNSGVGEGWGLPGLEAMACGVPVIAGDAAAYGEWAKPAALLVPTTESASLGKVTVIGGEPSLDGLVSAMRSLYTSRETRHDVAQRGLALANSIQYDWSTIGGTWTETLQNLEEE